MTFGAILRLYGRLATLPAEVQGEPRAAKTRELNARAEMLLSRLQSIRIPPKYSYDSGAGKPKMLGPNSGVVNHPYTRLPPRK